MPDAVSPSTGAVSVPQDFFAGVTPQAGIRLPGPGDWAVGNVFLPPSEGDREAAEQFFEQVCREEGLELAYHGHNFEFRDFDGVIAYDELLRLTDPDIVKLELDCGWVCVAGRDPVYYLTNHADRCTMLHARDFESGFTPTTAMVMTSPELLGPATPAVVGTGIVDYPAVLAAARRAGTRHCFVERDPFWKGLPILEALERDFRSLVSLNT